MISDLSMILFMEVVESVIRRLPKSLCSCGEESMAGHVNEIRLY
jgi:hypothetical protein